VPPFSAEGWHANPSLSHFNRASRREDDVLNLELKNIFGSNGIDMREDLHNQIAIGRQVWFIDLMLVSRASRRPISGSNNG
jgi:hypothetical protein